MGPPVEVLANDKAPAVFGRGPRDCAETVVGTSRLKAAAPVRPTRLEWKPS